MPYGTRLKLDEIHNFYLFTKKAIESVEFDYISGKSIYAGWTKSDLETSKKQFIIELDYNCSLNILASIEADFRDDYRIRANSKKLNNWLCVELNKIYKDKKEKASLEECILDTWKEYYKNDKDKKDFLSDLKGAFKFRHWLAHGRYWDFCNKNRYDYLTIYTLARRLSMLGLKHQKY